MKTGVLMNFLKTFVRKKTSEIRKVFLPTNPEKFGGVTGNKTFSFYA